MKQLIILRGLPGSGKSTFAAQLRDNHFSASVAICSTDNFFCDIAGVYKFDPEKLTQYHAANQKAVRKLMELDTELIIVDNTNVKLSHMDPYMSLASLHQYGVTVLTIGLFDSYSIIEYAARNKHGVPLSAIQKMVNQFER